MFLRSIIIGSVITAILISVLAATRLMNSDNDELDVLLYEIEESSMPSPLEPPLEDEEIEEIEEEVLEDDILVLSSMSALDLISEVDVEPLSLPLAQVAFNPQLSISIFAEDRAPADLPVVEVIPKATRRAAKVAAKSKWEAKVKYEAKATPKAVVKRVVSKRVVVKSHYSPSELDQLPRELRKGSFSWPSNARGSSGTVKLKLEISSSGKVTVLDVISSSDPKLNEAAKKVASQSRYTTPIHEGKAVKTQFLKIYYLKKLRR